MAIWNLAAPFVRRLLVLVVTAGVLTAGGYATAGNISEEAKLLSNLSGQSFGPETVAMSDDGSIAVVGGSGDSSNAGAVKVFTRSGTSWTLQATLTEPGGAVAGDLFGAAVSVSGKADGANIAVGSPGTNGGAGAVYVFTGSGSTWTPNATTLNQGATAGAALGTSVSIQGFVVAAGAPTAKSGTRTTGVVFVYTSIDSGATWTHTTFRPNGGQARTNGLFGASVAIDGSTIAVGSPAYHTGNKQNSGAMFIFVNNGGVWTQQTSLRPGNIANNFAGASVGLSGNVAALGAPGFNSGRGTVYVYTRTGTTWSNTAALTDPGNAAGDAFGSTVSVNSFFVIAGAPGTAGGQGALYEFGNGGSGYSLVNSFVPTDLGPTDNFGASTSVNSGRVLGSSPFNVQSSTFETGNDYVFVFQQPSTTTITGIVAAGDFSTDSLTGVPYSVFFTVSGPGGTPTGTVDIDDGNGGTCSTTLVLGAGSCLVTSSFFGSLTITASYLGDLTYSPSKDTHDHNVTGNHFVFFNPADQTANPPSVLQGTVINGISVQLLDGADAVVATDSTTQVTVTVMDTCGNPNTIGTVTLASGVADLSGLGPKFYTVTWDGVTPPATGALNLSAAQAFPVLPAPQASSGNSGAFDVIPNPDIIYPDGFEDCRL